MKDELVNELSESLANYMFPGIVDTSSDDVTDVQKDSDDSVDTGPIILMKEDTEQKSDEGTTRAKGELEQDALYQRKRREISSSISGIEQLLKSRRRSSTTHKSLLDNPFWDFKIQNLDVKSRSRIPAHPMKKQIMSGMLHKRWRIPGSCCAVTGASLEGTTGSWPSQTVVFPIEDKCIKKFLV